MKSVVVPVEDKGKYFSSGIDTRFDTTEMLCARVDMLALRRPQSMVSPFPDCRRFLSQVDSSADKRHEAALIVSNAFAAMGNRMQLLLHGWLIVAWGHNLLFL